MYYYGARWYDPYLNRWIQPDTIIPQNQGVQSWDRYAYANNNPVRYNDPSGHCFILCTAIIGGAVGAIVGAVGYTAYTAVTGTEFNTGHVLLAAGGGAVAGALIGTGVGIAAGMSTAAATTAAVTGSGTTISAANSACGGDFCASEAQDAAQTAQQVIPAAANEATALAQSLGRIGESGSNIVKNTTRIPSLTDTASYRIPDQLIQAQKLLSEVKNVAYQSYTSQIQDYLLYAKQQGYRFELFVRENTSISDPLQKLIDKGEIILKSIQLIQ